MLMGLRDSVRAILGTKPVKVGELAARVEPKHPVSSPKRRLAASTATDCLAGIEVVPEYEQTLALLRARAPLILATGGAGTGKSTLIRYLRAGSDMRMAVVAPTGVAALNAGGVTIHSLFKLPPKLIQAEDVKPAYDRQLFEKLELLVIDEVSMVRPDLLDGVDRSLRLTRQRITPFGGVQVLLLGDLFQLPPVAPRDQQLVLREMGYATDYFFSAKGVADSPLVAVLLTRVFRQVDPAFVELLNMVREGKDLASVLAVINESCLAGEQVSKDDLVLTTTNRAADQRNRMELDRLKGQQRTYTGAIEGTFKFENDRLPSPMDLALKPSARVMFTKNDDRKRWVNGTTGRVVELKTKSVRVELDDSGSEVVEVETVSWEQYRYEYDDDEDQIVAKVVGRYSQLPLMLAWAVTIHKAQGKTLSRAVVDLGARAFASGQVYVALSRVRALSDLRLLRPIREDDVRCDPLVTAFYEQLMVMTTAEA
ncbi:MAG: AAA family ATPase [Candidatus Eisenbacteria bacterium]|nr:AAA family ATPase [Candidatus Eisenbacteria bacterium]